jgi:hypothetical protein
LHQEGICLVVAGQDLRHNGGVLISPLLLHSDT